MTHHTNQNLSLSLCLVLFLGCDVPQSGGHDAGPTLVDGGSECPLGAACAFDHPDALAIDSLATLAISEIHPAAGVDYVALYVDGRPVSTYGTACGGATDGAACSGSIDALPEVEGFGNACGLPAMCPATLVVTRGDDVLALSTVEGMLDVLGSIDAPAEAALLVFASRPAAAPSYVGYQVHRVATVPGGFDVHATYLESDCDPIVSRGAVLHVPSDGAPTVTCDTVTSCTPGACI